MSVDWLLQKLSSQLNQCQLPWYEHIYQGIANTVVNNTGNWQYFISLCQSLADAQAISRLKIRDGIVDFSDSSVEQSDLHMEQLPKVLRSLCPWRKGPFSFMGIDVDSEWQCQQKWNRLAPLLDRPYTRILDAGGGNGYFAWRLLDYGDSVVIADPSALYWGQYFMAKQYLPQAAIAYVPLAVEQIPDDNLFDLVVCMGVLYHSPAPFQLLRELRKRMLAGATLIMETLVIDGDENSVLTPKNRYANMANIWAIPSIAACKRWLERCGFVDIESSVAVATSRQEQRVTSWSNDKSLADSLNPDNNSYTVEGYPAPQRVLIKAKTKSL